VPEYQNVKKLKGELDQYGADRFGRLIFATIRKSVGLKELTEKLLIRSQYDLLSTCVMVPSAFDY